MAARSDFGSLDRVSSKVFWDRILSRFSLRRPIKVDVGAAVVVGSRDFGSSSSHANGGVPVRVISNFSDAVAMRIGNTRTELALSSWHTYRGELPWLLPACHPGGHELFLEVQTADGLETELVVPASDFIPGTIPFDPIDPFRGPAEWDQNFSENAGRWMSYGYPGDGTHIFYPVSHEKTGGPDGGGFIWTDYSRTSRDVPDANSFLVLINYVSWARPWSRPHIIDCAPKDGIAKKARFSLRSDTPTLNEGSYCFWVLDINGRMHKTTQPLAFGVGAWGPLQEVEFGPAEDWTVSYKRAVDFSQVRSFGISLFGAVEKPADNSRLSMGPIRIGI